MKIAIMQPYFFPYLGYFQLIHAIDVFVIFDDVNYINKGYINRNNMLLQNNIHPFNLFLEKASQNKLINEINLANNNLKLIKTIEIAYKKSKCFDESFPIIESIINSNEKNLAKFLGESINSICNYLELNKKIIYSSELANDKRNKGQQKIIDIVKLLDATEYINPIGGQEIYKKNEFIENNIKLNFIKMNENLIYKQFNNEFIPNLSIIDVLMFNNNKERKDLLKQYILI
jgi:hypothetical protein